MKTKFIQECEDLKKEIEDLEKKSKNNFIYEQFRKENSLDRRDYDYKCLHCGKRLTGRGIYKHLRNTHNLDIEKIRNKIILLESQLKTKLETGKELFEEDLKRIERNNENIEISLKSNPQDCSEEYKKGWRSAFQFWKVEFLEDKEEVEHNLEYIKENLK